MGFASECSFMSIVSSSNSKEMHWNKVLCYKLDSDNVEKMWSFFDFMTFLLLLLLRWLLLLLLLLLLLIKFILKAWTFKERPYLWVVSDWNTQNLQIGVSEYFSSNTVMWFLPTVFFYWVVINQVYEEETLKLCIFNGFMIKPSKWRVHMVGMQ
jgi:hypothetical protein